MYKYAHPNGFAFQAQGTKKYPRYYRRNGFWQRFTEMYHAIGDGHDKNCIVTKPFFKPMDHEASEKEFKTEKLK